MESLSVGDYMNKSPVTFTVDMPVVEAVEKLLSVQQTGGPVIDQRGTVIGFLSEQDCLSQMVASSYYNQQISLVKDIMQKEVLSIKPYMSVLELAQQMLIQKPKFYPVVDDDGRLLGSINRTAVLRAIDVQFKDAYSHHP
jgi:predicted transcriptional regulator